MYRASWCLLVCLSVVFVRLVVCSQKSSSTAISLITVSFYMGSDDDGDSVQQHINIDGNLSCNFCAPQKLKCSVAKEEGGSPRRQTTTLTSQPKGSTCWPRAKVSFEGRYGINNHNKYSLLHLNIRSLKKHHNDLVSFLSLTQAVVLM